MKFSHIEKWLKPAFIVLILLFFFLYLRDLDFSSLDGLVINWPILFLASAVSLSFRYWGVVIWRHILKDLGAENTPPFSVLADVYAKAWMGRYIPGTVTWIAGKIYMASKLGISKSRLTVSSILEGGVQIVATLSLSLFILAFDPRLSVITWQTKLLLAGIAIVSIIMLLPPILNRVLAKIFQLIRRKTPHVELRTNFRATFRSYILYVVGAFITGSSYFFLTLSLYPEISLESYWFIIGAFILAGALGMVTPFVPSGLGVRDGVQLVLLSMIMPKEVALVVTVVSRIWSAAIDLIFYALARLIFKLNKT